ncbi:transposase family protein [Burkholderia mallei]|nr:transposase family protein [Burkholderia mallei]
MPVKELCRKHGFSDASFYTWRAKFGGMEVSEARRLKGLEVENGPTEETAGRSNARYGSVEGCRQGKALSPQAKREAVLAIREKVNISERRACRLVGLSRSVLHYDAEPDHENGGARGASGEVGARTSSIRLPPTARPGGTRRHARQSQAHLSPVS